MNKEVRSVLFVTTSFPRFKNDFAGSFVFQLAKYLVRDGLQVTVLAPGAYGYPVLDFQEKIRICRIPYFYPKRLQKVAYDGGGILANVRNSWLAKIQLPFLYISIVRMIQRYQVYCDIIHCHWLPTVLAALTARKFSRPKRTIVYTPWGSDMRLLPKWLSRWAICCVDGCISGSVEADDYLQDMGCTNFRRITPPVDQERFSRNDVPADLYSELGIDDKIPIIAFVGRLNYFKDPITFIRACDVMKQKNFSYTALIAGDGELMNECKKEVKRYHLEDSVLLLGMRSDPERLLRISTTTVHISPIENNWATSIAEAMFMGVPVVVTDSGYTGQLFTHNKDCLIVPAKNPFALAEALQCLIENEALRNKLIRGGKELLFKFKKDSVNIVKETRVYYEELFNRNI